MRAREVEGEYTGVDATMVKMELSEVTIFVGKVVQFTTFSLDEPSGG